jgi:hypothetical protein
MEAGACRSRQADFRAAQNGFCTYKKETNPFVSLERRSRHRKGAPRTISAAKRGKCAGNWLRIGYFAILPSIQQSDNFLAKGAETILTQAIL